MSFRLFLSCLAFLASFVSAIAIPANDDFADAEEIVIDAPLPKIVGGSTVGATVEAGELAIDPTYQASVWYRVTAPSSGIAQIDTTGSDYDTRLLIGVGGSYGAFQMVAMDDDPSDGTSVIIAVDVGVEYRIAVFGDGGATGNLSLNIRDTDAASISGNVTAISGGASLSQSTVEAYRFNDSLAEWVKVAETTTNDLGGYTIGNLQEGFNYRMRAIDPAGVYSPVTYVSSVFVEDGSSIIPNPDLFGINMAMPTGASISGQVSGLGGGVSGITVDLFIWNSTAGEWQLHRTTTSQAGGAYNVTGISAGTCRLRFSDASGQYLTGYYDGAPDLASATDIAVLQGQSYPNRDITLQVAGTIEGVVRLSDTGLPVEDIQVQALAWDSVEGSWEPTGPRVTSGPDGSYALTGLLYDTYKVAFVSFDNAMIAPSLYGGGVDPALATDVIVNSSTPHATGIDQSLPPVQIIGVAPGPSDEYTLTLRSNAYAQYNLEFSADLLSWLPTGIPFKSEVDIPDIVVNTGGPMNNGFWRLTGPEALSLSPIADVHERGSYFNTQESYRWVDRTSFITTDFIHAFGYGDFNGDGNIDRLVFPGESLTLTPVPAQLILDIDGSPTDGSSIFVGGVPSALHPRKLLVGDLNGDGIDDAVLIDHGYDDDPFPGAPLQVLLSAPGGMITTTVYNDHIGFHHAGALGDVDHDGDLDLFLSTTPDLGGTHLIFINDGLGAFTPQPKLFGDFFEGQIWASEFFDLDKDGFLDLAIGGTVGLDANLVLWGSENGTYGGSVMSLKLPDGLDVYDYDAEDLDGDGDRDLLVTLADIDGNNHQFRLFINHGGRSFVDETLSRFDYYDYAVNWIDFVYIQDNDTDTDLDIVADVRGALIRWENNGSGYFTRQP